MKIENLKGNIPDTIILQIISIVDKFELNTPLRLSHFLAQAAYESGDFKLVNENLNYSAKGLRGVFPKYFPTDEKAAQYERQPQKIGNLIYGSRMGNGAEASGDGYKYHGRGFIQLTGKDNYAAFSKDIGEDCVANPDLVATKYPLASAAWFFKKNNINSISDQGATSDVVTKVTKRVNGGIIGLDQRLNEFGKFYKLLLTRDCAA